MRHQVVEFTAMGCPCSVEAFAKSEAQLHECLALARAEIERIEAKYSRYRHGSWLSELNRSAGLSDSIELDQESRGLFDFADQLYIISKHRFDITSGVLGKLWRFAAQDDPMTAPPSQKAIDEILPLVNQRLIERGPDAIRLPLVGMSVDFGGIAKEYACDRVAQLLRLNGIDGGCVCLGGDITVFGKRDDERPWLIGIERPQQPTLIEHAVSLSNASLATSGDYARCFDFEGKRYGHLLDATTGWPVHDLRSVSVIAPLCTAAGAVARLAMLQGATWQRFIEGYCRNTREVTPLLLARVQATITRLNQSPATRVAFVLQVGDLVEGLCGSEELAVRHNSDAIAFVRDASLGAPFLFTKGNHDITGPGAVTAFSSVFHPFLTAQARAVNPASAEVRTGSYTVDCGRAQFAFFDAYEAAKSLEWFEAVVARRTAEHLFVVVHPPVVPYGARSTWHIFSSARDRVRREKFLTLLGEQHALVIGGHIHRYNTLARTAGRGRFAQLAVSSVLTAPNAKVKDVLNGLETYTPDQIKVEPNFSPASEAERRAVYVEERPFVREFEYADLPGYAVVTVDGPRVAAQMFAGTGSELWRTVDLTALSTG